MRLLRSMLFTPGNNARMIQKAGALSADAVILDLEDAVPMAEKEAARALVRDSLPALNSAGSAVFVRVNSLATGLTYLDLGSAVQPGVVGILLPKTESRQNVEDCVRAMAALEVERGLPPASLALIPQLESAKGVLNAREISSASPRIIALAFGALDFARDMGTSPSLEGTETFYARAHLAVAARAAEVQAVDSPWIDFRDTEGLIRDAQAAKRLGFRGKLLIHPAQIEPVTAVFSPSPAEVAYAKRVVEAFLEAESRGLGAVSLDGRMIDAANARQAQDVLAWAEVMSQREPRVVQRA